MESEEFTTPPEFHPILADVNTRIYFLEDRNDALRTEVAELEKAIEDLVKIKANEIKEAEQLYQTRYSSSLEASLDRYLWEISSLKESLSALRTENNDLRIQICEAEELAEERGEEVLKKFCSESAELKLEREKSERLKNLLSDYGTMMIANAS